MVDIIVVKDDTTQTERTPPAGEDRKTGIPYLVVLVGARAGEMFRLSQTATVIGRSEHADVRLADDGVSRRHAILRASGSTVTLEDLDSVNGTYRNGARIVDPVDLADGDKISMGGTTILKFTYQDALDEQFNRRLYDSVVKDDLTGLYNRRYFDERLHAEMTYALRHDAPLALLLLDIDHFKRINDEHGHQTGDATLREVAGRLASTIRGEDVLARFGGEEFAILCRGTEAPQAVTLAERLRLAIARGVFAWEGVTLRITISIGIAVVPGPEVEDVAELVSAADTALYEAKRQGRNRSVAFGTRAGMQNVAK